MEEILEFIQKQLEEASYWLEKTRIELLEAEAADEDTNQIRQSLRYWEGAIDSIKDIEAKLND